MKITIKSNSINELPQKSQKKCKLAVDHPGDDGYKPNSRRRRAQTKTNATDAKGSAG